MRIHARVHAWWLSSPLQGGACGMMMMSERGLCNATRGDRRGFVRMDGMGHVFRARTCSVHCKVENGAAQDLG